MLYDMISTGLSQCLVIMATSGSSSWRNMRSEFLFIRMDWALICTILIDDWASVFYACLLIEFHRFDLSSSNYLILTSCLVSDLIEIQISFLGRFDDCVTQYLLASFVEVQAVICIVHSWNIFVHIILILPTGNFFCSSAQSAIKALL